MTPSWRWLPVLIWLAVLAVTAHGRLRVWQNEYTLWADAAAKAPLKPRPVMNLGRVQELSGFLLSGEVAYRRTLELSKDPRRGDRQFTKAAAASNLAHVYIKRAKYASAMQLLDKTLFEFPEFPYAHYNRGAVLWLFGACDEAARELARARSRDQSLTEYPGACGQLSP